MDISQYVDRMKRTAQPYTFTSANEQAKPLQFDPIENPTEAVDRYVSGSASSGLNALMPLLLSRRAAGSSQGVSASALNAPRPTGRVSGGSSRDLESFINSIAKQESGGNYKAVNRKSGALGKYQIMPANIASWSKQALGRSITPQQFLNSPQLQEQVARDKLRRYFNKYGAAGASQAWYGGPGSVGKNVSGGKGYPSSNQYAAAVVRRMKNR